MEPQTDLEYTSHSSITDDEDIKDVDHSNVSILVKQLKTCDAWIAQHNTFDVIDHKSTLTVEQQLGAHKALVAYLRIFRSELADKIRELNNGR